MKYERNLIKCLVHRARAICSDECLDEELNNNNNNDNNNKGVLSENGHPEKFIDKNMNRKSRQSKVPKVPKRGHILKSSLPRR
ncbi:unnamed protein product [Trichobilharzia regenti]|nr:unnamed protein product [Trichobilharzia regenti]